MAWPSLLVMVRHAESQGNVLHRDERALLNVPTYAYPLTNEGRRQAAATGKFVRDKYGFFDIYYTSYYARVKETMQIMYPQARVYEDPRLAEAQRGIYHTMTQEQITAKYPEELARKDREGLYHYRPPGGENWPDIELRIHSFLGTLARDCAGKKVLIVVHGHWLLLLQRLIDHFSIDEAVRRYNDEDRANAGVWSYTGGERLELTEVVVPWKTNS